MIISRILEMEEIKTLIEIIIIIEISITIIIMDRIENSIIIIITTIITKMEVNNLIIINKMVV